MTSPGASQFGQLFSKTVIYARKWHAVFTHLCGSGAQFLRICAEVARSFRAYARKWRAVFAHMRWLGPQICAEVSVPARLHQLTGIPCLFRNLILIFYIPTWFHKTVRQPVRKWILDPIQEFTPVRRSPVTWLSGWRLPDAYYAEREKRNSKGKLINDAMAWLTVRQIPVPPVRRVSIIPRQHCTFL